MEVRPDTALILHLVPYRDADLMVSMITAERGRLDAAAPSGRKSRKRFEAGLDKFCFIEVEISTDRQGRHRLRSSRLLDAMDGLRGELERMAAAELVCDVVRSAAPEGSEAGVLLEPLVALLRLLSVVEPARVGPVTWGGLAWILAAQGFFPRDCRCSRCARPPDEGEPLYFSLASGALRCRDHALEPDSMRVLTPGAQGLYDAAAMGNLRPLAQAEARPGDLKQFALYSELRVHEILNRTPRSLAFFHQIVG